MFEATFTLTQRQDEILTRVREMSGVSAVASGDTLTATVSEPFDEARLDNVANIVLGFDPQSTRIS
jgi:hypothetical protein